jgi:hypothetical protein
MSRIKRRNVAILGAENDPVVEPTENEVTEPTSDDPTVEPSDDEEETTEDNEHINQKVPGWAYPGYSPVRGEDDSCWYAPEEKVIPRVYHEYAHEDLKKRLYPDLYKEEEEPEVTPVDPDPTPVDPTPDDPDPTPVDPTPAEEPVDPVDPTPEVQTEP